MPGPFRAAVVGLGRIAQRKHLPNLLASPAFSVVGLSDLSDRVLEGVGRSAVVPRAGLDPDFRRLFELGPDVVFVLNHDHYPVARAALEAGIAVFVEKPLAWTSAQARDLVSLAERKGVWLGTGYMRRHDPHARWIAEFVRAKGPPLLVGCRNQAGGIRTWIDPLFETIEPADGEREKTKRERDEAWKAAVSSAMGPGEGEAAFEDILFYRLLAEFLSHDLDLLRFWLGGGVRVERAQFFGADRPDLGRRAYIIRLDLRYGDVPVTIEAVPLFDAPWLWKESFEVVYPRDFVSIAFGNPFLAGTGTRLVHEEGRSNRPASTRLSLGIKDPFALELEWIAAELGKKPPDLGPAREAAETVALVERLFRRRSGGSARDEP
ncbi:MAG: Gfo/Idh/MocA family oxidoreductase [Candidatus Aminicenantes bacterium]|nr:Gfo/Idh/MocA family oxidoreductase [Candidatus Aminicenantes bacterium]